MRSGLRRLIGAAAVIAALAATARSAADDTARPRSTSGVSTVWRKGETTNVGAGTEFREGDIVRVPEGSRLTIAYDDDSSIALVGPSALRFGQIDSQGRRVVLGSGAASEVVVHRIALEIQAPNPYDASLVMQNSRGFARVSPGDRIVFQRAEGDFGKVWRGNRYINLGTSPWVLNVRDGARVNQRERDLGDDSMEIMINGVKITIRPASQFTRTYSEDGGLSLSFQAPGDSLGEMDGRSFSNGAPSQGAGESFGEVDIGQETSVYVYPGQGVGLDANGDITRFEGVSHLQRPLFEIAPQDDPIENAADGSPSLSRRR
jgi:hypothetical protein